VPPAVAKALRKYGIDVTTTVEAGLRTHGDREHLEFARSEGRVIVTQDADFLRLASTTEDHPGVAYCHKEARSIGEIIRALILIYEVLDTEDLVGRVEFL
jgi:predicted nuclease of predicted toxin-antitoxin system